MQILDKSYVGMRQEIISRMAVTTSALLRRYQPAVSQAWFVDDATAAGQLAPLLQWWKQLLSLGPLYGYYPNATKTYLIVKPQLYDSAKQLFGANNVQITCHGHRHLSAAIGT